MKGPVAETCPRDIIKRNEQGPFTGTKSERAHTIKWISDLLRDMCSSRVKRYFHISCKTSCALLNFLVSIWFDFVPGTCLSGSSRLAHWPQIVLHWLSQEGKEIETHTFPCYLRYVYNGVSLLISLFFRCFFFSKNSSRSHSKDRIINRRRRPTASSLLMWDGSYNNSSFLQITLRASPPLPTDNSEFW